jgi:hypothetical protein
MAVPSEASDSSDQAVVHRTEFGPESESPAAAVSRVLAAANDDVVRIESPLYDHLDPDALELLADHAGRCEDVTWELTFDADEFDVTVTSDGRITVR